MKEIIPAILTNDKEVFKEQLATVASFGAQTVQIDVMDGKFVPEKTILPEDIDAFILSNNSLTLEAHLMVENPTQYLTTLFTLGFTRVVAHFQALTDPQKYISDAKELGLEVGIAINPDVELSVLDEYIEDLDFILIMSVIPGAQGRAFEPIALEKIKHCKEQCNLPIEVDGGVNNDTIAGVIEAGADRIAIGSGIWKSDDPTAAFTTFSNQIV